MLEKWYVMVLAINMSGGNSEEIIRKNTQEEAEITFHDKASSYLAGKQVRYAVVKMLDPYGNAKLMAVANHEPEPEPEA